MTSDDQEFGPLEDSPLGRLNPTGNRFEQLTPEAWQDEFKLYLDTSEGRKTLENIELSRNGLRELFQEESTQPELFTSQVGSIIQLATLHRTAVRENEGPVILNLFEPSDLPEVAELREDALTTLTMGAIGLAFGPSDDFAVESLLNAAFGSDLAAATIRQSITGRASALTIPDVIDRITQAELDKLVVWGTLQELLQAFQRHGRDFSAYASWVSRARAYSDGITLLDPPKGCAGDIVVIHGKGFGPAQPPYTTVRFATARGCADAEIVGTRRLEEWSDSNITGPVTHEPGIGTTPSVDGWQDTMITVRVPPDVGIGCVGFLRTDGPPPEPPFQSYAELVGAAGMYQSILGDVFGDMGVMQGQQVVDIVGRVGAMPGLPCPPCLPENAEQQIPNKFVGGPPVIRAFAVNGARSVQLHPGEAITLAWEVEGAVTVTLTPRTPSNSPWPDRPHHLPPVDAPILATGAVGPFAVPWEGIDDWDGEYVLSATNECTTQPVTDAVRVEMREHPPLFGIADTHVHFVSHLAFGGYGIWGRPHASDPALTGNDALADALPWCDGPKGHGPDGVLPSLEGVGGHLVGGYDRFDGWPRHTTLAHQQAYIDWIKRAVDGGLRLVVCLAVNNEMLGTRMTELYGSNLSIDDSSAITRQLDAMEAMVKFVDDQAGGSGQGWMAIAKTPTDARRIVAAGKLALVPGVEVDSLGGWPTPAALEADAQAQGKTPQDLIAALVQGLSDRGVRHVFPVHAANNAFGGTALFVRNYDAVNYFLTGRSFEVETADQSLGISYRIDEDNFMGGDVAEVLAYHGLAAAKDIAGEALLGLTLGGFFGGTPVAAAGAATGAVSGAAKYPCPPQATNWADTKGGHINAQGLTPYGELLIAELMRRGMIIDIDHMGHKTTERVLQLCEGQGYPVASGHTGFRELKYGWRPSLTDPSAQYSKDANAKDFGTQNVKRLSSEVDKTEDHLRRLHKLGGMVSPITYQRDIRDCGCGSGSTVVNDNAGSSKSFAQAYLYAIFHMHHRRVGLGTDINGAGELPGPRFGPQGAAAIRDEDDWEVRNRQSLPLRVDQVFAQQKGVRYLTPMVDYRHHRFMDYAGSPRMAPFDAEQRDFWEAIVIWRSGTTPELAEQPPTVQRTIATQNFIINLATGLRAQSRAEIPISILFPATKPWPLYNVNADEQLAAYLASHSGGLQADDSDRTRALVPKLMKVWEHWQAMGAGLLGQGAAEWTQPPVGLEGSGLYDSNGNLTRSMAGLRDFDINMDGMAHYGMLPDLMQDLLNVGMQMHDLATLYRSAEDYIRVWERCEAKRLT